MNSMVEQRYSDQFSWQQQDHQEETIPDTLRLRVVGGRRKEQRVRVDKDSGIFLSSGSGSSSEEGRGASVTESDQAGDQRQIRLGRKSSNPANYQGNTERGRTRMVKRRSQSQGALVGGCTCSAPAQESLFSDESEEEERWKELRREGLSVPPGRKELVDSLLSEELEEEQRRVAVKREELSSLHDGRERREEAIDMSKRQSLQLTEGDSWKAPTSLPSKERKKKQTEKIDHSVAMVQNKEYENMSRLMESCNFQRSKEYDELQREPFNNQPLQSRQYRDNDGKQERQLNSSTKKRINYEERNVHDPQLLQKEGKPHRGMKPPHYPNYKTHRDSSSSKDTQSQRSLEQTKDVLRVKYSPSRRGLSLERGLEERRRLRAMDWGMVAGCKHPSVR